VPHRVVCVAALFAVLFAAPCFAAARPPPFTPLGLDAMDDADETAQFIPEAEEVYRRRTGRTISSRVYNCLYALMWQTAVRGTRILTQLGGFQGLAGPRFEAESRRVEAETKRLCDDQDPTGGVRREASAIEDWVSDAPEEWFGRRHLVDGYTRVARGALRDGRLLQTHLALQVRGQAAGYGGVPAVGAPPRLVAEVALLTALSAALAALPGDEPLTAARLYQIFASH